MRLRLLRCHLYAIALAAFFQCSLVQSQTPSSINSDGFAGAPISAPVGQTLQQTMDDVNIKRSKTFIDKVSPPIIPSKPQIMQDSSGIVITPSTRFLFDAQNATPAQELSNLPKTKVTNAPQTNNQAAQEAKDAGKNPNNINKIKFEFKNTDAAVVIEFIAKLYGLVPVIAPGLNQQITISTPGEVSLEDAYGILTAVLNNLNYTVIRTDKFLKVVPKKDAPQSPIKIYYGCNPGDLPDTDEMLTQIIPCKNVSALELIKYVTPLVSSGSAATNVAADPSANLLIVSDIASNVKKIIELVQYLDMPVHHQFSDLVTTVYRINYLKVKDLADCLNSAFKIKATITVKDDNVVNNQIIIQAFPENNTLLVTAIPELQKAVGAAIKELDQRKKQVLLNVKFLEATYRREFNSGSDMTLTTGGSTLGTGPTANASGNILADSKTPQLSYLYNNDNIDLKLQALLEKSKVKLLSQPRLLTADNEPANLVIGKQHPILKSTTTVSESNNVVSDYSYIDIGINLSITPHINPENDVILNMDFKLSNILDSITMPGGVSVPELSNREIKTSLTVKHAHTLIICGIITQDHREETSSVPILGDIPWIGWIFGQAQEAREQTELIILITPTVVDKSEAEDKLTLDEQNGISLSDKDFKDFKKFFDDKEKDK